MEKATRIQKLGREIDPVALMIGCDFSHCSMPLHVGRRRVAPRENIGRVGLRRVESGTNRARACVRWILILWRTAARLLPRTHCHSRAKQRDVRPCGPHGIDARRSPGLDVGACKTRCARWARLPRGSRTRGDRHLGRGRSALLMRAAVAYPRCSACMAPEYERGGSQGTKYDRKHRALAPMTQSVRL